MKRTLVAILLFLEKYTFLQRYTLAQRKWFRKLHGGEWTRVYFPKIELKVWIEGKPLDHLKDYKIIDKEIWEDN